MRTTHNVKPYVLGVIFRLGVIFGDSHATDARRAFVRRRPIGRRARRGRAPHARGILVTAGRRRRQKQ